jgi:primase-polymerase (primpol)-like protein
VSGMTPPSKPTPLEVCPENIPQPLKETHGWVLWHYVWKEGKKKWDKPPVGLDGVPINAHDPQNWMDFATVYQAYRKGDFDGIGFDLNAQENLVGVDLDNCIEDGAIEHRAQGIVEELGSYVERSPSGEGLRILGFGKLKNDGRKKGNIEMYDEGRYLTITGHRLDASAVDLQDFDEALNAVHDRIWSERPEAPHKAIRDTRTQVTIPDEKLLEKIRSSKQADDFEALFAGGPGGYPSNSEADLAFCNMLAFWCGCDHSQIDRIVRASGRFRDKWDEDRGGQTYGEITIQKAIGGCREVYSPSSLSGARDFLETIEGELKEDPRKLKDRDVLAALLTLRERDPIEFGLLAKGLSKIVTTRSLNKALDLEKARLEEDRAEEDEEDANWLTPDILEKAKAIMRDGDPLQYLIYQAQRSHVGDINYQKVILLSVAASNSLTSQGIHPGGTGDKGSGKTDAMKAVFHLLPPVPWKKSGSLSSLAPFYMGLQPGTIFYSDDVVWDLIGPIFRQATGSYQDGTIHNTISKDREYRPLEIPARFTWWLTSVEATHKEQENDRQYPISTDPSDKHKRIVSKEIAQRRARKERRRDVDEGVLVARAIIWLIKSHNPFQVLIPQANKAEWILFRDFRGQERFWDTVEAFAILRFMQREADSEGWLIASDKDVEEARSLFKADNLAHATKLTKAETALLGVMLDGAEYSQAGLSKALGIAQQTVSERLNAIMGRTKYITSDKGPNGKILYSINAKEEIDPALWADFEMVRVESLEKPTTDGTTGRLQGSYSPVTGIPTGLNINISKHIPVSLQVKREGECGGESGVRCGEKPDEKIISPTDPPKKPVDPENQQQGALVGGCNPPCKPPVARPVTNSVSEAVDLLTEAEHIPISELLEVGKRREAEHLKYARTPEPKGQSDRPKKERSATKKEALGGRPTLSEPALKDLLDESAEITPERYVAKVGGTVGTATRQLDLAVGAYGWSKRKIGFSVIYGPGARA